MDEKVFYLLAGIPVLGVAAQWIAWRLRLPSILVLLTVGVLLGRFVDIDQLLVDSLRVEAIATVTGSADQIQTLSQDASAARLLFPLVSLAVGVIMFEGGLSLRFSELRQSGSAVLRLVTLGCLFSWALTSWLAWTILNWDYRLAILLGAILVVTGPTVVIPLLRYIRPNRRVGSVMKWEGIVIDPIGALLAVFVFDELLRSTEGVDGEWRMLRIATLILATLALGCGIGLVLGFGLVRVLGKYWLPDNLHGVLFLAAAIGGFALSTRLLPESGLVAVTVLGIYLANQNRVSLEHIVQFKENLVVFLLSSLFIVLGSRLDLGSLVSLGWRGMVFLVAMIVLVRPASVMLALLGTKIPYRERYFYAMLAPRGIVAAAVASIFSLKIASSSVDQETLSALLEQSRQFVPVTFLVIVGTVAVYGLGAAPIARRLGLADANPQGFLIAGAELFHRRLAEIFQQNGVAVALVDTNFRNITEARILGLRATCASILSEQVSEESDLSGIGRLLAMTGNDEVNLLACREFAHVFGKANVFQLAMTPNTAGFRGGIADTRRARELFGNDLNVRNIRQWMSDGADIKATSLTEEFDYEAFRRMYPQSLLLFAIEATRDGTRRVHVATASTPLRPAAKQTVIALIPKTAPLVEATTETATV